MNTIYVPNPPCVDCLLISVCRQKFFLDMKKDCRMIETYLFVPPNFAEGHIDFEFRLNKVYDRIHPVHWKGEQSPQLRGRDGEVVVRCDGYGLILGVR